MPYAHGMKSYKSYKKSFFLSKLSNFVRKMVHIVIERLFSFFQSDLKIFLIADIPFKEDLTDLR